MDNRLDDNPAFPNICPLCGFETNDRAELIDHLLGCAYKEKNAIALTRKREMQRKRERDAQKIRSLREELDRLEKQYEVMYPSRTDSLRNALNEFFSL